MSTPRRYMNNVTPLASEAGDRRIGALLLTAGRLTPEQLDRVLRAQKEDPRRFGQIAVDLRYVSEGDVRQALARQFEYPYLEPGQASISEEVSVAYRPYGRDVEALRALRTQLKLRWFDGANTGRALAIISPRHRDGRSYLAANLAVAFSQLGERTLLIDADMRRPRQHQIFQLDDASGLSTVLAGRDDEGAIQRLPQLANLSVLPAGPMPPNPVELLERATFSRLLEHLRESYDAILVDTPAAAEHADAHAAALRCHAALMVVRKNATRIAEAKALADAVRSAEIVGTVLNEF
jgi:chain length determinant protein tyrosine kinase EpsG